jgi:hypothetical protein
VSAAAVGTPVTFVIDHLTPEAARRMMAVFDRPRGAPLSAGQLVDLAEALNRLPHGDTYGRVIGMWTCLHPEAREPWLQDGCRRILAANGELRAPAPMRPVAHRGRGPRRGRVVDARRAFGRRRRSR